MGVNALWQLLRAEDMVEWYRGNVSAEYAEVVKAMDGTAVAIDLSTWLMQADQQTALLPHFSREERCMKVAFERALQWLRHGCLPVPVAEGRPPAEKQAAQRARFASRNGYAGGGSKAGAAQFQRLGQMVGRLLEELGLPVFYAPGEAEAVCAALNRAGCVDAAASSDSDTLLYGVETLLHTVKLSTSQPRECELKRVQMASLRRRLGLRRGGAKALAVLAVLSGSDYDLDGAHGVGSAGGLAVARYLLQGDPDDGQVLQRLSALLQRPPKQELLDMVQCTGCQACGHEGNCKGKIKRHSSRNRCACCPPSQNGPCPELDFQRCGCAFHQHESERRVEKILERVRKHPTFLEEAQAAIAVFERQGAEADAYVAQRAVQLGCQPGQKLTWLHRPRVRGVFDVIEAQRRQMLWDLPAVRSKLLPALLEWDLRQQGSRAAQTEFMAAAIQKVHGLKAKGDELSEAHWRYVLTWDRLGADLEGLGVLEVQPKKPRANSKAADDEVDAILSQAGSQAAGSFSPGSQAPPEQLTVREFDLRWLKEQPAEHRAVRISAVHFLLPQLEDSFRQRQAGTSDAGTKGRGGKKAGPKTPGSGGKGAAEVSAAAGGVRRPRGSSATARPLQLEPAEDGTTAAGPQRNEFVDLTRSMAQRKPGSLAAPAAAAAKPGTKGGAVGAPRRGLSGYGLGGFAAELAAGPQHQQRWQQPAFDQHLPTSAADMRALIDRAVGVGNGGQQQAIQQQQQQQQQEQQPVRRKEHPAPQQRGSPQKKLRTPQGGSVPAGAELASGAELAAPAGGSELGSPGFEVLLSSPDAPPSHTQQQRQQRQALAGSGGRSDGRDTGSGGNVDGSDEDADLVPLPLALRMARMLADRQVSGGGGSGPAPPSAGDGHQQQQQQQQGSLVAQTQPQQQHEQPEVHTTPQPAQPHRFPRRGKRSVSNRTPVSTERDIRTFYGSRPTSPASPGAAASPAAGVAAAGLPAERFGAGAAAAAGDGDEAFVDLLTPPRARLGAASSARLPQAAPQVSQQQQQRMPAPAGGAQPQGKAAPLSASPIDLTLSDSD